MYLRNSFRSQMGFCFWILQVLIVWLLIYLLLWLGIQPKSPSFTVTNFSLPTLLDTHNNTIRNSTTNTTNLIIFNLQISNPNKGIQVYYDQINISLSHGNWVIGSSSIVSAFWQGHRKSTAREVRFIFSNISSSDSDEEQFSNWKVFLSRRGSSSGNNSSSVSLKVDLVSWVRYRILCWKTKLHLLNFEGLVPVGSDGKMVDGTNIKLNHSESYTAARLN